MDASLADHGLENVEGAAPTGIQKKMGLMQCHTQPRYKLILLVQRRQERFDRMVALSEAMLETIEGTKIVGRSVFVKDQITLLQKG